MPQHDITIVYSTQCWFSYNSDDGYKMTGLDKEFPR